MIHISFILPVYGVEKYISECLDSIYSQDMPESDYEVICVDDCSPDRSNEIIRQYQQKHNNLILIEHKINKMSGGARNTGIRNAKGEYVCVYGKLPLMQSANCVANTNVGCLKDKGADFSYIVDRTNAKFCVYRNCNLCYNTIFNSVPSCLINEKGIDSYKAFLSFVDENEKDTENICDLLFKNTNDFPKEYTKAYWNRGVE